MLFYYILTFIENYLMFLLFYFFIGTETVPVMEENFSYVNGRNGSTRKKLSKASGCIIEWVCCCCCCFLTAMMLCFVLLFSVLCSVLFSLSTNEIYIYIDIYTNVQISWFIYIHFIYINTCFNGILFFCPTFFSLFFWSQQHNNTTTQQHNNTTQHRYIGHVACFAGTTEERTRG